VDDKSPDKPVIKVDLRRTRVTMPTWKSSRVYTAPTLHLNGTGVTDAGLKHLKALTQLQYVNIGHAEIGDAGLEHLKGLTKLQTLVLDGTKVTEAGLKTAKRVGLISITSNLWPMRQSHRRRPGAPQRG